MLLAFSRLIGPIYLSAPKTVECLNPDHYATGTEHYALATAH